MTKHSTNQELLILKNDIDKWAKESIAFRFFNQHKINEFFQRNKLLLDMITKKLQALEKTYVEFDENKKPVVTETIGLYTKYKFLNEQAEQDFVEQYAAFMSKDIIIHY